MRTMNVLKREICFDYSQKHCTHENRICIFFPNLLISFKFEIFLLHYLSLELCHLSVVLQSAINLSQHLHYINLLNQIV